MVKKLCEVKRFCQKGIFGLWLWLWLWLWLCFFGF